MIPARRCEIDDKLDQLLEVLKGSGVSRRAMIRPPNTKALEPEKGLSPPEWRYTLFGLLIVSRGTLLGSLVIDRFILQRFVLSSVCFFLLHFPDCRQASAAPLHTLDGLPLASFCRRPREWTKPFL